MNLNHLINTICEQQRWSYGDVARQSSTPEFPDGTLSRSTVQKQASLTRLRVTPDPDILESLARGLKVPLRQVQWAAVRSTGIELPGDLASQSPDIQLVVAALQSVSPAEQAHHRRVLLASVGLR